MPNTNHFHLQTPLFWQAHSSSAIHHQPSVLLAASLQTILSTNIPLYAALYRFMPFVRRFANTKLPDLLIFMRLIQSPIQIDLYGNDCFLLPI
jgi:hypothetical protein